MRTRILVLDDALSAVDTYTEEEILARLRRVTRDRTSIIVSHRIARVVAGDLGTCCEQFAMFCRKQPPIAGH